MEVGGQRHPPAALPPGKNGMGPRDSLDGCGRSRHAGIRSPDSPARSSITILTELSGPPTNTRIIKVIKLRGVVDVVRMGKNRHAWLLWGNLKK
jgi:hypothetical protein